MALTDDELEGIERETCTINGDTWQTTRLITLAENLEVFDLPLKHLFIGHVYPNIQSTKSYIRHILRVLDADLKYPIILSDDGSVMNGNHRIAKAIIENKESILAVRFEKNPKPCYSK